MLRPDRVHGKQSPGRLWALLEVPQAVDAQSQNHPLEEALPERYHFTWGEYARGKGNSHTSQGLLDTGPERILIPGEKKCLRSTSQNKCSWSSGNQWSLSSVCLTVGPGIISYSYFPDSRTHTWNYSITEILSNWQDPLLSRFQYPHYTLPK